MISIKNLSKEFSAKPIFSDISFFINDNDKISLVGKNGAGKSTLLKIISGEELPTEGNISRPSEIIIGYLPQQMKLEDNTTLKEEVKKIFKERFSKEIEIQNLQKIIETHPDPESTEFYSLLEKIDILNNQVALDPLSSIETEIEKTLIGLGFRKEDFERMTSEFSGGWRMRIELAKILLKKPDILLLDEPTNHLDIESIQWLENFILTKAKAVVIVSHDQRFMDNVTKRTIEISCGKIYDYKVNYSAFQNLRLERIEQQKRAWENQQKQIEDIKTFIERFRYQATKANQVQSRIKQLEKIIPIEIDNLDTRSVNIKFPPADRSGDFPLTIENLSKSYEENQVLSEININLRRGDKVAFIGRNGEGKTTLVKCILNQIPYSGTMKLGHNLQIGYFAQNQAQLLNENLTVYQTIDEVATGEIRTRINDILGSFMFSGEDVEKKVGVLSGGEKTRLAMIKLLLQPVNFLVLDEPTNHLDIKTKEILKEALKQFNGTIIIVSHDRSFLDGLVDKVYEFTNHRVIEHLGGINDFLYKKNLDSLTLLNQNTKENGKEKEEQKEKQTKDTGSYKEMKERNKLIRKIENSIQKKETIISQIESQLQELEKNMNLGTQEAEIYNKYSELNNALGKEMEEWENLQNELDKIQNNF